MEVNAQYARDRPTWYHSERRDRACRHLGCGRGARGDGYNEFLILYVLAMGSPTRPLDGDCYESWTATYQWEQLYGYEFLYAGPLFIHQFSHAWIDFRGIQDRFMREKRCDYFEKSRRATEVQREYTRRNRHRFTGYDEDGWGLTACDGPNDQMPVSPGTHTPAGLCNREQTWRRR